PARLDRRLSDVLYRTRNLAVWVTVEPDHRFLADRESRPIDLIYLRQYLHFLEIGQTNEREATPDHVPYLNLAALHPVIAVDHHPIGRGGQRHARKICFDLIESYAKLFFLDDLYL